MKKGSKKVTGLSLRHRCHQRQSRHRLLPWCHSKLQGIRSLTCVLLVEMTPPLVNKLPTLRARNVSLTSGVYITLSQETGHQGQSGQVAVKCVYISKEDVFKQALQNV